MAAPATVVITTDATATSEAELREAAACFLPDDPAALVFTRCKGGVNNICYYVDGAASGERYVLRVYNNGFNTPRVEYEHAVLQALAGRRFSFQIPAPLPSLRSGGAGSTHARLASGTEACLFRCIPGGKAVLGAARAIGAATAELVAGMAGVRIDLPLPNPLYRNIYESHHKIDQARFEAVMRGPAFDGVRPHAAHLLAEVALAEALVARILAEGGLPSQQIHADLHFDNVLVTEQPAGAGDDVRVSGVLDFEFSANDWTVMEMCVGLSKYVAMPGIEPVFAEWVAGYSAAGGRLSPREAALVPELIILRVLCNVVYFAGRALSGEDAIEALTGRVEMYANRCRWIRDKREWMVALLTERLVAPG